MPGMFLIRLAQTGVKSLLLHKLRSFLTMLGIIFGVCSVIAMLAIGEGASYDAQERIRQKGARNIILKSKKPAHDPSAGGARRSYVANYGLKYTDIARITNTFKNVRVLPQRVVAKTIRYPRNAACEIVGTLPIYPEFTGAQKVKGRFLTDLDEQGQHNVCVLTATMAETLFAYKNPLGQHITVSGRVFTVVGVYRESNGLYSLGRKASGGAESAGKVFVPLSTFRSHVGEQNVRREAGSYQAERIQLTYLTVQFPDEDAVVAAGPVLRHMLSQYHKKMDFVVEVPLDELRELEATKRLFNFVLGSIAAISLLVGGIGIMNIMLATVTERTREIGIRRALGAKREQIITQFLTETGVLSIVGGLIGVVAGIFFPYFLSWAIEAVTDNEYRIVVTLWSVLLAFGISVATGIVFGVYPARRAADLDPIEALRHN
jgi:putative ABC transport system permease protein